MTRHRASKGKSSPRALFSLKAYTKLRYHCDKTSLSMTYHACVQLTAVFAQLTVNGKWEGPHVFMVRIRDDNMHVLPGVRIQDLGPKMGLNGVDNGQVCTCGCTSEACCHVLDFETMSSFVFTFWCVTVNGLLWTFQWLALNLTMWGNVLNAAAVMV
jgi:hypothetical protein